MKKQEQKVLFEKVKEIMTIKYIICIFDKMYKEGEITKREHELLIKNCEEKLEDCYKKGGLLWKKEK